MALLKAGLVIEKALKEVSETVQESLNNELKRTSLEIQVGTTFNQALLNIAYKF